MKHATTHVLIALAMMSPFVLFGYAWLGAFVASGFYTGREVYQYYILGKTHKGRFDHEGWIPVVLITFAFAYIISVI